MCNDGPFLVGKFTPSIVCIYTRSYIKEMFDRNRNSCPCIFSCHVSTDEIVQYMQSAGSDDTVVGYDRLSVVFLGNDANNR